MLLARGLHFSSEVAITTVACTCSAGGPLGQLVPGRFTNLNTSRYGQRPAGRRGTPPGTHGDHHSDLCLSRVLVFTSAASATPLLTSLSITCICHELCGEDLRLIDRGVLTQHSYRKTTPYYIHVQFCQTPDGPQVPGYELRAQERPRKDVACSKARGDEPVILGFSSVPPVAAHTSSLLLHEG
eukprot:768762-Hanusia_phi.AAC.3